MPVTAGHVLDIVLMRERTDLDSRRAGQTDKELLTAKSRHIGRYVPDYLVRRPPSSLKLVDCLHPLRALPTHTSLVQILDLPEWFSFLLQQFQQFFGPEFLFGIGMSIDDLYAVKP